MLGAVILAGGRASRLDNIAKPWLHRGGTTLLQRTVDAARTAGAARPIVVGPPLEPLPAEVTWLREDPPFGGPAAAVVAALAALDPTAEWTLVLASDLRDPHAAVSRLVADLALVPADTDGICLGDARSRPQWLTGVYRTRALRRAAEDIPDAGRDQPIRILLDDLALAVFRADDEVVADVDTWDDVKAAGLEPPHPRSEETP
ncbi:NTP transferase domain-containing protein [Microbacterium sp. NPDC089189]|uniref:molybdenum cofactor guanylyltransferase n=1 Tax=Microbacterium sp. NPDC089189 TaxID=3154972 RepID=UPI003440E8CB